MNSPQNKSRLGDFLRHPLFVALVSAFVAGAFALIAVAIESRSGGTLGGVLPPTPTAVTSRETTIVTETVTTTATGTTGTDSPDTPGPDTPGPDPKPNPLLLADIPRENYVKRSFGGRAGAVTIDGQDYPSAYSYTFSNCSACTYVDEIKIDRAYTRMTGVFGLTDDTRHDDVIDGVVYASIYANDRLVFGPKKVEYPAKISFDIKLDASRITLQVGSGTNVETAAWADVKLHY